LLRYHVSGIPTQYIIAPNGKIVQSFVGYGGPSNDLANAIKAAQALPATPPAGPVPVKAAAE
jgi:hypothetical protein